MSALEKLNNWFTTNLLYLNLDKTNFTHFKTKNPRNIDFLMNYGNGNITLSSDTKFLGLTLDNLLQSHIPFCSVSPLPRLFSALHETTFLRESKSSVCRNQKLITHY
jgi:hypothetical protein